jgi:hypothetical protein
VPPHGDLTVVVFARAACAAQVHTESYPETVFAVTCR